MDLGGKSTSGKPYWHDFGAKFGHFVGDVEAKSGYGIGHVEAQCQISFSHVVGFVSQSALARKHQDFKWILVWPSWALLRYLKATAMLLGAKLGDFEGKLGYRRSCSSYVGLFCSTVLLLLHPEIISPSRTKILSGFLRAMLAPCGVKVRLSYGHVGAHFSVASSLSFPDRPGQVPKSHIKKMKLC